MTHSPTTSSGTSRKSSNEASKRVEALYDRASKDFAHWEKTKDIVDQCIDMTLNFRQSGHPGGSRSKVHAMLTTLLGGVMRWDIRHPEKRFNDRYVLVAGHCTPLLYSVLAVLNESLRIMHERTGEERYRIPMAEDRAVYWEDLLTFRRNGGLPGHAEMEGKTLFVKANTGPSGHGSPVAAGIAMALKRAGVGDVRVFAFEGEGGLTYRTPGELKAHLDRLHGDPTLRRRLGENGQNAYQAKWTPQAHLDGYYKILNKLR